MLSISVVSLILLILFLINKRKIFSFPARISLILLTNLLILETLCYIIFILLIAKDDAFLLIGNQKILDRLIKSKVVDSIYIHQDTHNQYFQVDNNLGYSLGKSKHHQIFFTNSSGLRGQKEYPLIPSNNVLRMAVFGDSFVFGDGEFIQNTWPNMLERSVKNFEVLNFGVSGYGLAQSYLHLLQDGLKFNPDVVLFNYLLIGPRDKIDPKDMIQKGSLKRSTSYRAILWLDNGVLHSRGVTPLDFFNKDFRDEHIYKPLGITFGKTIWSNKVFSLLNFGLLAKQIGLKKLINQSEVIENKNDLAVNLKLLDNLIREVRANNAKLIIFYGQEFKSLPKEIEKLLMTHNNDIIYVNSTPLLEWRFSHYGFKKSDLLNKTNHYNAQGNLIYAEVIASILRNQTLGYGQRQFKFNDKINGFLNVYSPSK